MVPLRSIVGQKCYPEQLDLRQPFRLAVVGRRRDRQTLRHLLDVHVARQGRGVVDRAGGGEEKADLAPLLARLLGDGVGQAPCGQHVALAVEIGREVGRRIVGQPGQVDDGAYTVEQTGRITASKVGLDQLQVVVGVEGVSEPVRVHHAHRLAQGEELPNKQAADVPGTARYQNHNRTVQIDSEPVVPRLCARRYGRHTTAVSSPRASSRACRRLMANLLPRRSV
jgi:hypothetical protein